MGQIITGTSTVGVTLAVNPTIIDGSVVNRYGNAIYGSAAETWTVTNHGVLLGYGSLEGGLGIDIRGGTQIINAAHAYIYGNDGAIDVGGAATIDNGGGIYNYNGYHYGYGPSPAIAIAGAGVVINRAGAGIYGSYGGIVDESGHFSLLNRGVISGYQSIGVAAAGTITNARTGTIAGYDGVDLSGGTIDNAGLIENGRDYYGFTGVAIYLLGQADAEIIEQKTGTLIGDIAGFVGGDTIDEAGITITSVKFAHDSLTLFDGTTMLGALSLYGDFHTREFILKSDGHGGTDIEIGAETFTGTFKHGVELTAISNTVAAQARINGISAGRDRTYTLVNYGSLVGTGKSSHGVEFDTSGQITNIGLIEGGIDATADTITNTGVIIGKYGIAASGGGTITNSGLIEGGDTGISAEGGTIANSGLIKGKIGIQADGGTIVNSGTIEGREGVAIDLLFDTGTDDIILEPGSVLKGRIAGFETGDTIELAGITATGETFAHGILTLTNAGNVVDTIALDGFFDTAAFTLTSAGGGTDISIAPAETFTGHHGSELVLSSLFTSITSKASFANGLVGPFGRDWTVVNAGTLSGPGNGVLLRAGTFTNAGTLGGSGNGVLLHAGAFTNSGTGIIIGAIGVNLYQRFDGYSFDYYSQPSLSNAGSIVGLQGAGVSVYGAGFVGNLKSGSISGASAGVDLSFGTFSNAGQISGPTGVAVTDGGNLYNAAQGIISGYIGVQLNPYDTLTDAGTIAATLSTAGAAIAFGAIAFSGIGATLVLDRGNVIEGAIDGFQAGDIIDFAATTITSDSFSNNILTLLDGAATIETLTLAGTYSQGEFSLVSDGSLGTELVLNALDAAPAMHFLRPGWGDAVIEGVFARATAPPQAKAAIPNATPSVSGWLPLHQTQPTPIPAVTLQHG